MPKLKKKSPQKPPNKPSSKPDAKAAKSAASNSTEKTSFSGKMKAKAAQVVKVAAKVLGSKAKVELRKADKPLPKAPVKPILKGKVDSKILSKAKGKMSPLAVPAENQKDSAKESTKEGPKKEAFKKEKPSKKPKKKSEEPDFEEDILADASDDIGSEELPDLSEFEETTEEEAPEEDLLADEGLEEVIATGDEEVILTDAEGRRYCRVRDCDQISSVEAYCRYHYLFLWKKIQIRRGILMDGKFERYVEELTFRYPDKFLEVIRKDMRNEKDFLQAIQELEIDESAGESEFEDEAQNFIDEVRGVTESGASDDDEF